MPIDFGKRFDEDGMKKFLSRDDVQEALACDDIESVYSKFFEESNGFTNILTEYFMSIGIEPIDYIGKTLSRDIYEITSVERITIPGRIQTIGYAAFKNCRELVAVMIEEGVKAISFEAFNNCPSLAAIAIPDSVNDIAPDIFRSSPNVTVICNTNTFIESYCKDYGINYSSNDKHLNESLTKEQETLIEDVQENAEEEKHIIDEIRKLITEQGFEEEEKLNGIAFTQEVSKPVELIAQFYVDTTDLSHSSYIKSEDESFASNYSNKGHKDSIQKAAALFIKEFIDITTADII